MRKTIILLVTLFALLLPAGISADEQEVNDDAVVQLTASKVSSYTVKLPRIVDVSENSVSFIVQAKGDITADKQLSITADSSTTITDSLGRGDVAVNVLLNGGPFTYDVLPSAYDENVKVTFTLNHVTLGAGTYSGSLPVTIALENTN